MVSFFVSKFNYAILALIGINWAMIGADAYAMERQRLKGSVDNCHSLIQKSCLICQI
jgi:hypothetical protein